ncbi:hypothetical protein LZ554_008876 [Drepanopeziza brunnea f. sp. 'monogermtubi']|nr:hypothetical protein LZ554_008876 [Drepanopeziza brunnea f. sp. 'monogermtubi']
MTAQLLENPPVIAILAITIFFLLYKSSTATNVRTIRGIFEIPGDLPVFGHLLHLGDNHAEACEKLWKKHDKSVYQIRLGNTRAVVLNSFDDCRRMYITHQSSVIDRPVPYTIKAIAKTKGLTIGTSPWNESTKNRRKAAGTALSRPKLIQYKDMLDRESMFVMEGIDTLLQNQSEVDLSPLIQQFALNMTLTLCYGVRIDQHFQGIASEILDVGHAISRLRGTSENLQDYIPFMRYLPKSNKSALSKDLGARRDAYLESLLGIATDRFQKGELAECIYSAVLQDKETKLTKDEISTVCLSLVSGGFETVPSTINSCLGSLSTREGQVHQAEAVKDIRRYYKTLDEALEKCLTEEKVPYINALVKEALRYYTVLPLGQPRKTIREIEWNGSIIPTGTIILFNTQAANHDTSHFGDSAHTFDPTRWLKDDLSQPQELESSGIQHFGFGGGSRMCPGYTIAQRMIYIMLFRLLISYKIEASQDSPPNTHFSEFNTTKTALVAVPARFKVQLTSRDMGWET